MQEQKLLGDCGLNKRRGQCRTGKTVSSTCGALAAAALTHRDSDRLLNTGNWVELNRDVSRV